MKRRSDNFRWCRTALNLLVLNALAWPLTTLAQSQFTPEQIKAAYLYRMASYVTWPVSEPSSLPFKIEVIGDEDVAHELERLLPGRTIQGRTAQVQLITRINEIDDAQVLYIGPAFTGDVHTLIDALGTRPILIVTDEDRGLADGSTINFVDVDQHVRLEVSLTAAGRSGLKISSQLLSVAAKVEGHLHSNMHCEHAVGVTGRAFYCLTHGFTRWASAEPGTLR